jgi:hypothetical protein
MEGIRRLLLRLIAVAKRLMKVIFIIVRKLDNKNLVENETL